MNLDKFDYRNEEGFEHLKEGVNPIIVSVGTMDEHFNDAKTIQNQHFVDGDTYLESVDYYETQGEAETGVRRRGYAISGINENAKYSDRYSNCTGLVVLGIDKKTGREISFISHQYNTDFLNLDSTDFRDDLISVLEEMRDRCNEGTIDSVIFGGNNIQISDDERKEIGDPENNYRRSISFVSSLVKSVLDFYPQVVGGPKIGKGTDTFVMDTQKRRGFLIRTESDENSKPVTRGIFVNFSSKDIDNTKLPNYRSNTTN